MPTPVYINGFSGSVTIGSFTFDVVEWSIKVDNGLIDVTNTGSSSYGQFISGVNSGSVSIKAFWDTANVYTGTANLKPGVSATTTLTIGASGKTIVATMIIQSVNVVNSPTAGVQFNLEGKLTSSPTYPT
jgi:hypothetical protein